MLKKMIVLIEKADVSRNKINEEKLEQILNKLGDNSWCDIDYNDTIEQIKNGESIGIVFTRKRDLKHLQRQPYMSFKKGGEYTDLYSENLEYFEDNGYSTIRLKHFLQLTNLF